jgi:hypothetical protein
MYTTHVLVVGSDELREGVIVTGRRRCDDAREILSNDPGHGLHIP